MKGGQIVSVLAVLVMVSVAWVVLGSVTTKRTEDLDRALSAEMSSLWGPRVFAQPSPWWAPSQEGGREHEGAEPPAASEIDMRLAAGVRFAVTWVALAQVVYLVGFSYAFFWESHTGLTVVIGAILTLFLLMQATGRIDWSAALSFEREASEPSPGVAT